MQNKKNLIFWGGVAAVGIALVLYGYFSGLLRYAERPDPDIIYSPAPTLPPETGEVRPTETPFAGLNGIKAPATCQVSGEAEFSDPGLYSSNTKLSWQNVDSQGRLIKWRISPKDNLAIGPNIFANLTVPNGEYDNLTIRLPENPISKTYLLTVSVTYGQFIDGDLKVKEIDCSGQVKINLNF